MVVSLSTLFRLNSIQPIGIRLCRCALVLLVKSSKLPGEQVLQGPPWMTGFNLLQAARSTNFLCLSLFIVRASVERNYICSTDTDCGDSRYGFSGGQQPGQ